MFKNKCNFYNSRKCFLDDLPHVLQYRCHLAQVHQVEIVAMQPLILDVVNDKLDVWRHIGRLNGTEVDALYQRAGILIRNCGPAAFPVSDMPFSMLQDGPGGNPHADRPG